MRALAHLRAEVDHAGALRLTVLRSAPPLSLRPTAGAVYLVGSAAGPLGGDDLSLRLELGPGAALTVRSAAASIALPGPPGGRTATSCFRVDAQLAAGAVLRWLPEPLIAVAGCDHRAVAQVRMEAGARLCWRDEIVLGRQGEPPGSCRSLLRVDLDGRPLLRHELRVGVPGWDGPAVTAGAGAVGQVLLVGPEREAQSPGVQPPVDGSTLAWLPLEGPGVLVGALAADALTLRAALDAAAGQALGAGLGRTGP